MVGKECFRCRSVKPLGDFYAHPGMRDGRLNKCKVCTCADVRANRKTRIDHYRQFDIARYRDDPHRREMAARQARSFIENHPKARAAHLAVARALRSKRLNRMPCEECGATRVHAHHDDYDAPLVVRWLCVPHHSEWHIANGPGKNIDQEEPGT